MVTQLFKGLSDMFLGNANRSNINRSTPENTDSVKASEEPQNAIVDFKRKEIPEKNRKQAENISKPVLSPEQLVLKDKLVLEIMTTLRDKVPAIVAAALAQQNNEAKASQAQIEPAAINVKAEPVQAEAKEAQTSSPDKSNAAAELLKLLQGLGIEQLTKVAMPKEESPLDPLAMLSKLANTDPTKLAETLLKASTET